MVGKTELNEHRATTEGLGEFNPKHIVGLMSVDRKSIKVLALEQLVSLEEKRIKAMPYTASKCRAQETVIKSVQLANGGRNILSEVSGPIDRQVFLWISEIAKTMKKTGISSAFFPAFSSVEGSGFLYGNIEMDSVRTVFDTSVKYARVCEDGQSLIITNGKDLQRIDVSNILEKNWHNSLFCKTVYSGSKEISFIGRFQGNKVPVTFADGVCSFNISTGEMKKMTMPSGIGTVSAFIGVVEKGINALIGNKKDMEGSILTIVSSSELQTAA